MGGLGTFIAGLWTALPSGLKKFIGYGLSAGIALVMVVFAFLSFPLLTDYIKQRLGIREDVESVTQGVRERSEEEMNMAIAFTTRTVVNAAMDSLRHANDSLFNQISTELIEPGIDKLNSVEANVRRLNERLGLGNDLLKQQADAQRETNNRIGTLQQQLNTPNNEVTLNAILQQLQDMQAEQEDIRNRLKTTKQKF
jgi:hypothetical protein